MNIFVIIVGYSCSKLLRQSVVAASSYSYFCPFRASRSRLGLTQGVASLALGYEQALGFQPVFGGTMIDINPSLEGQ